MTEITAVPKELQEFFENNPKPALAFSGGTDSTYLFYAAVRCGAEVDAYFVKSQFQPMFELEHARKSSELFGKELHVLLCNILTYDEVRANHKDRCYQCKNKVFQRILEQARADKKKYVMDGTNASDDPSDRPGMKALEEMGIISPLKQCGLTKSDVRRLSKEAGLRTWNMPSNSCLATRIATDTPITEKDLLRVEEAEDELRVIGLEDFRVRCTDNGTRLETVESQNGLVDANRKTIEEILLKYFPHVEYSTRMPKP